MQYNWFLENLECLFILRLKGVESLKDWIY